MSWQKNVVANVAMNVLAIINNIVGIALGWVGSWRNLKGRKRTI